MQGFSISVLIPVYNEAGLVRGSIGMINEFLARHFSDYELVVVESGSTDGTGELCDEIAKGETHVKVVREGARNGFGSAIRLGYRYAVKDLVLLYTVDLPFPLECIPDALAHLSRYDCVLSYRSHDTRNAFRRIQSSVFNILVKTALGLKVRQVNSAFKLLRRATVQNMSFVSNHWFFEAELLYRLQENGVTFIEIPVPLTERAGGTSSITLFTFLTMLRELLRFRHLLRQEKKAAASMRP